MLPGGAPWKLLMRWRRWQAPLASLNANLRQPWTKQYAATSRPFLYQHTYTKYTVHNSGATNSLTQTTRYCQCGSSTLNSDANYVQSASLQSSVSVGDSMPQPKWTLSTLMCAMLLPVAYKPFFWLNFPGLYTLLTSNEGTFRCFAERFC